MRKKVKPWGEFEEMSLKEFFPRHGPYWEGWNDVLPDRTSSAISNRAHKLGLHGPKEKHKREPDEFDTEKGSVPSPIEYERTVTKLMKEGLAPSQIDTKMHWVTGTAMEIIKARWERQ